MKKVLMLAALVAAAASVMVVATGTATAADGPAIVIKNDGLCGMVGSDADGNIIFGGIGQVETQVENGNKVMIKCKGVDITNLSGSGQSYRGFLCGTPLGITEDSHATVSASGVATLTCTSTKA